MKILPAIVFSLILFSISAAGAADDDVLLNALVAAYPEELASHDSANLYWRDGTVMPVSTGQPQKSFDQLLKNASILDQIRLPYPRGTLKTPPDVDDDPGRFRNTAFFRKMYGNCGVGDVERHMVSLVWLPAAWGHAIRATAINGVADRLKAISAEVDALPDAIRRTAYPIAGVFSCRPVADTGQPSMHAYAAAIDLNITFSDYWLWSHPAAGGTVPYRNRMPQEIVDIFERHGFIWGGKWYHYDTMHFEYRPELLSNFSSVRSQP
jgi:hypothetical protein